MSGKDMKVVMENAAKKRERDQKVTAARDEERKRAKKQRAERRSVYLENAEKYFKQSEEGKRSVVEAVRKAKAEGNFYVPAEAQVAFVVRIRGILELEPKVRKILQLLRLRQINNGVFVRVNKAVVNMLRRVEPYIVYGYPSRETISKLVYKRGYGKVNGQRLPLTDNAIVEKELGKHGIVCVEDLINEIATCGPKFKEAANFLWPFKLNNPKGGFEGKRHPFHKGGSWGNREEELNSFIKKML